MVKPRECSLEQDLLLCWPEPLQGWGWPGGWQGLRGWKERQDRSVLAVDRSVLSVDIPAAGLTLHTLPCWLGTASSPFPKPTGSTGRSLWVWVRPSCPPPPCAAPTGVTEPTGSVMVWAEMRSVGAPLWFHGIIVPAGCHEGGIRALPLPGAHLWPGC